jgi:hypothetical protein
MKEEGKEEKKEERARRGGLRGCDGGAALAAEKRSTLMGRLTRGLQGRACRGCKAP